MTEVLIDTSSGSNSMPKDQTGGRAGAPHKAGAQPPGLIHPTGSALDLGRCQREPRLANLRGTGPSSDRSPACTWLCAWDRDDLTERGGGRSPG